MKKVVCILFVLCVSSNAFCQGQTSPEEREKQIYEAIQTQVERLSESLDLEDWQIFYVDSILTHNINGVQESFQKLSEAKVSNYDHYYAVQDEWQEKTYQSFKKIFNEDQWAKYLKNGAAKDKKARDKRMAKSNTK